MFFSLTRPVFSICHTPFTLYITFIVVAERLSMAPASIFFSQSPRFPHMPHPIFPIYHLYCCC